MLGCWFTPMTAFATQGAAGTPQPIVDVSFPCPDTKALGLGEACGDPGSTEIGGYILRFYQFGVAIAGILAVGLIVAGSIYISVSGGNPDKQSEGKDMITSAIWGLVLLFGSYLILNTVNPELITLKNPNVPLQELPVCIYDEAKDPSHKNPLVKGEHGELLENKPCKPPITEILLKNKCEEFKKIHPYLVPLGACAYRQSVVKEGFTVRSSDYYGEYEKILDGSTIWVYPYFKKNGGPSTARCLVYAYQHPDKNDGKTKVIELNPKLELCATQPQESMSEEAKKILGARSSCDINEKLPAGTYGNNYASNLLYREGITSESTGKCYNRCNETCTSFEGIPGWVVEKLILIQKACIKEKKVTNCVTVTGGTEIGHLSHGMGKPIVDLSFNTQLADFLKADIDRGEKNYYNITKICTTPEDKKYRHSCDTDEDVRHLHIEFK